MIEICVFVCVLDNESDDEKKKRVMHLEGGFSLLHQCF